MKSNAEYIENDNVCPNCGSENLQSDTMQTDTAQCWRRVECPACGLVWNDVYKLTGYEVISLPWRKP